MIDRLEMAKRFVREQLGKRDDIIGALVFGSVARGEDTDTSDIDLGICIREDKGEGRRSLAHWQEGVFLESATFTTKGLGSLEEVMGDPINATHMRDALILYDPSGFFAELQKQVREVFMEPRWLRLRLKFALDLCRKYVAKLRESTVTADPLGTCDGVWWISHAAPAVPLSMAGITPSSTRKLSQLSKVCPGVRVRVIELECSLPLTAKDVEALLDTCTSYCTIMDRTNVAGLPDYMTRKAESMVRQGALNDAVDVLWCALRVADASAGNGQRARALLQEWLHGVGWEGVAAVEEKLRLAESLLHEVEAMAGAEPSESAPATQR